MKRLLFLVIVAFVALSACTPTNTVEPTPEAEDAPITLEQNYSIDLANSTLSVDYPEGWDVNAEFPDLGLVIATTEELAQQTSVSDTLTEEQVYIEILFAPEANLEQNTPSAVLQAILEEAGESDAVVSDIQARTLNGKIAAYVTIDFEEQPDGIQLVVDSGDAYSTMLVAVADGQIETYLPVIEAMAGSIEYLNIAETEVTEEVTEEATEEE